MSDLRPGTSGPPLSAELRDTLRATEAGFHVGLIATFDPDLVWAPAAAGAADWVGENHQQFDQFPVRTADGHVGVLLRADDVAGLTVENAMRPLKDGLIVSSGMPIADLIPQFRESHFRLVLRGDRIDGLVTQSDLLKLPGHRSREDLHRGTGGRCAVR